MLQRRLLIIFDQIWGHIIDQVAIIKEIKSLVEGMNLVQVCIETENLVDFVDWDVLASKVPLSKQTRVLQAKKFVESAPAVVKADIAKDEAEKIQAALQAVGGECVVE